MRILYITRANLCLRRAHSHNILATASLLGGISDVDILLVSSGRQSCGVAEMFERHGAPDSVPFEKNSWLAASIVRKRKIFDVLYVRDPRLLFEMMLARALGKKVIFEIHGSREWRGLFWLWRAAFRVATAHIFITEHLKQEYGASAKHSAVIPCASVDLKRFVAGDNSLRKELGTKDGTFIVLYLGSSDRYYNIDILLEMLSLLPEKVVLVVAGIKDDERARLQNHAQNLGLEKRTCLKGRVDYKDVPKYLLAADVLVNPKAHGFAGSISAKLYEYLAAGKPIVASAVPADREVLTGHNALIVESKPEAFAKAVQQLLDSPDLRARLSDAAREDAKKYTDEARAKAFAEFKLKTWRSYRASHTNIVTTKRYEELIYGANSYDTYLWEYEQKILDREMSFLARPRYLDFAGGTGRVSAYLENRVSESVCVDVSAEMLELAKAKLARTEIVLGDLTREDALAGRTFYLFTAFRFFLNAEPRLRGVALEALKARLADNGTLIFNI
ncbi:MAG: glycosyltransferase, partial [Candidatus Ryanbacteria bacterium]|nr:glycosyltransferase [Candidatus Ryanbacteria bacterium]